MGSASRLVRTRSVYLVDLAGEKKVLNLAEAPLASGGEGAIYLVNDHHDLVAKLYHQPQKDPHRLQKLQAMLAGPPQLPAIEANQNTYVQIAWPIGWLVDKKDNLLGFAMPKINLRGATALENLLSRKSRQAFAIPEGYGYRIAAAANLAALVTELHACGHHVVDLKPINISVYIDTFYIAILDCDGFSIRGLQGEHYPAHQFSDGYIAPESLRGRHRPEDLGEDQDRFALAVVLFQLLNQGIHPYQGVPAAGIRLPSTNGERIERELYAYGSTANQLLMPSPWSIHRYLEDSTLRLFDRAFTSRTNRPSAKEWRDHLVYFADKNTEALRVCPKNNDHGYYSKDCGFCAIEQSNLKLKQRHNNAAPTKGKKRKKKQPPVHMTSVAQTPTQTPPLSVGQPTPGISRLTQWWQNPANKKSIYLIYAAIIGVMMLVGWLYSGGSAERKFLAAAENNQIDYVEYWLKHGADIDISDNHGSVALIYAVKNNNPNMVNVLLQHGASVNSQDFTGATALSQACYLQHRDIVELLLNNGADVNSLDNNGRTALHWAVMGGNREIVQLLLAKNADVSIKDHQGKTAIDSAASFDSSTKRDIIYDLNRAKSKTLATAAGNNTLLPEAVKRGDIDTVPLPQHTATTQERTFESEQIMLKNAFNMALYDENFLRIFMKFSQDIAENSPNTKKHAFQFADHTTKLLLSRLRKNEYKSAENIVYHYVNKLVPYTGLDEKSLDVASNALVVSILTRNDNISDLVFNKLLGPDFDITAQNNEILLFNLACYYAVHKQKKPLLIAVKQALKRGKDPHQFMTDTDFKDYWQDVDFLNALKE